MTHTELMNWEIFLDAVGFCCCILSVLYLFKLKRKADSKDRTSEVLPGESPGSLKVMASDSPVQKSFDEMLASATNDGCVTAPGRRPEAGANPYDEVRRLLDLGVEPHQIAERINLPECEINLIINLHRMQPDSAAG